VDLHPEYDPLTHYKLELDDSKLTDEEVAARSGRAPEVEETEPPKPTAAKRLDG